ncbi:MAG: cupin domain-containing protein [Paracoccaceae bacterium]
MLSLKSSHFLTAGATGFGLLAGMAIAGMTGPSEHKGLAVEALGKLDPGMIQTQTGLEGYFMQLRAITIEPGGQIAQHSHENRPGLVKVISGEWTEGTPEGETVFPADASKAIYEQADTVHWVYNHGDEPATAIVCDLTPAG